MRGEVLYPIGCLQMGAGVGSGSAVVVVVSSRKLHDTWTVIMTHTTAKTKILSIFF